MEAFIITRIIFGCVVALLSLTGVCEAASDQAWTLQKKIPVTYGGGLNLCGDSKLIRMSGVDEIVDTENGTITKVPKEFNYVGPVQCSPDGQYIFGLGRKDQSRRKWVVYRVGHDERTELTLDETVRLSADGKSAIAWHDTKDTPAPWGEIKIYNAPDFPKVIIPWYEARHIALGLKPHLPSQLPHPISFDLRTGQVCDLGQLDAKSAVPGRDVIFLFSWKGDIDDPRQSVEAITLTGCAASQRKILVQDVVCFNGLSADEYVYCSDRSLYMRNGGKKVERLITGKHYSYSPEYSADGRKLFVQVTEDTHPNEPYDPENEPILPTWIYVFARSP